MSGTPFAKIAHGLWRLTSRRGILVALGLLPLTHPRSVGAQLVVSVCGAEGHVCTHLRGCCEGLVCATSHRNPTYGVCIPGEGEHVAVTTEIVAPFSDGIVTQMAAELEETEAAAVEAEALTAEHEAAKDTRRSTRRSRKDTKRSQRRTRQDTARAQKRARRTDDVDDVEDTDETDDEETGTE